MPYSVTIARAIAVAFSMSLPAPVVGSWNTSSSAARPPSAYASVSISSARGLGVLVLGRQHERVPERAPTGQDRHLVHRRRVRQRPGDQRVATLVVRGDLLLVVAHHAGAPLRTCDDPVDRLFEEVVGDRALLVARGQQGRLVDHFGQVGTG